MALKHVLFLDSELSATVGLFNSGCESKIIWFESELRYGPDPNLDSFDGEKQTKQFRSEAIYITVSYWCSSALCFCNFCLILFF